MSAYSTREVTRKQAEDIYFEYLIELHRDSVRRLSDVELEEGINDLAYRFPDVHFLENFVIRERNDE